MRVVRVVCQPALAAGFALAGLPVSAVSGDHPLAAVLEEELRRNDAGIVLLQEQLYDALVPELQRRLDRSARPLVVPFPDPSWGKAPSAEDRVVELLRRAIGYRVRLR